MTSFPHHLLEGYRTFTSQRLPTEQSRYRELSEIGQAPVGHQRRHQGPQPVLGLAENR